MPRKNNKKRTDVNGQQPGIVPLEEQDKQIAEQTVPEKPTTIKNTPSTWKADAAFIDGNHAAPFCWADYCNYGEFVVAGGFMLFHDIYWQGAPECFGVSQAAEWIDRMHPMHVVFADHPVHRFFPWLVKGVSVWGGVGILRM